MEPHQEIADRPSAAKVQVTWRTEHFNGAPGGTGGDQRRVIPTLGRGIKTEIEAIVPGLMGDSAPSEMDLQARQVIIQHAETVNVYTHGGGDPLKDTPQSGG